MLGAFKLRRSEWVITGYFAYAAAVSLAMPVRPGIPALTLALNAAVIGALWFLAWAESLRHAKLLSLLRALYALPLMLLAYREMGWFAPETHAYAFEHAWIVWDRILLDRMGLRAAIEGAGPALPAILEVSYSLVYTVAPFSVAALLILGDHQRLENFLFTFLLGIYLSYVLFPFFPSEPPRTVFPGQDLPGVMTVFRRFNLGLLGHYGIHTSVFPSAHVSGSMAAAFAMIRLLPERKWIGRGLLILATLIAIATVYGRYHYAADAAAGLAVALLAEAVSRRLARRESAQAQPRHTATVCQKV